MATREPDCAVPPTPSPSSSKVVIEQAHTLVKTTEGILMLVGIIVFGTLLGAIGTYVLLTGRLPCSKQRVLENTAVDDDDEARQGLQAQSNYFDEDNDDDTDDYGNGNGDYADSTNGRRIGAVSTGLQEQSRLRAH